MKKLAALAASSFLLASPCMAADKKEYSRTSLIVNGLSYHLNDRTYRVKDQTKHFNEVNLGVGAEYRLNRYWHASAGFYNNSEHNKSLFFSTGLETSGRKFLGAGVEAGYVSGYGDDVSVVGFIYGRIGSRESLFNLRINALPPIVVAVNARVNVDKIFKRR